MITHIVLFRLHDAGDRAEAVARLRSLEGNVAALRSIEVGLNVVEGPRAHDVSVRCIFDDLDGLAAYQLDSFHKTVVAWMAEHAASAASIDYESPPASA